MYKYIKNLTFSLLMIRDERGIIGMELSQSCLCSYQITNVLN